MVKKIEGVGYMCSICNRIHPRDTLAVSCEQSHDIVYVPLRKEDIFKLLQFFITHDESLLTKELVTTLQKYKRGVYK